MQSTDQLEALDFPIDSLLNIPNGTEDNFPPFDGEFPTDLPALGSSLFPSLPPPLPPPLLPPLPPPLLYTDAQAAPPVHLESGPIPTAEDSQATENVRPTVACAFTFCSVCASPFEVRWNLAGGFIDTQITCPGCRQTVQVHQMHTHACFLRVDDGQFSLCATCFRSFIKDSAVAEPAATQTATLPEVVAEKPAQQCETKSRNTKRRGRKARCEMCMRVFEGRAQKLQHVMTEHSAAFTCSVCNARMKNAENLRRHALCHENGRFFCDACGAGFSHVRGLRAHASDCLRGGCRDGRVGGKRGVVENVKRFSCPVCHKRFSVRPSVSRHLRIVHQRLKPHLCPTCGKAFSSRYNLSVHTMKNH